MKNKVYAVEHLEHGKKQWIKQQKEKEINKIKRLGGTIYNEDGTPSLSYITVQTTSPDKWFNFLTFASNQDCVDSDYTKLDEYYFEGNGCYAYGTYNHATQLETETGSTDFVVATVSGNVTITYNQYSSFDCTGSSTPSNEKTYSLGCDGIYFGAYTTTVPLYDDNSPFTNDVPGFGEINYANDNPTGDTDYATWFNWQTLSSQTNGDISDYGECGNGYIN